MKIQTFTHSWHVYAIKCHYKRIGLIKFFSVSFVLASILIAASTDQYSNSVPLLQIDGRAFNTGKYTLVQ